MQRMRDAIPPEQQSAATILLEDIPVNLLDQIKSTSWAIRRISETLAIIDGTGDPDFSWSSLKWADLTRAARRAQDGGRAEVAEVAALLDSGLQLPLRLGSFPEIYCKEVLEVFLDRGMSPNQQDVHGNKPLHIEMFHFISALDSSDVATLRKRIDMTHLLCERGANPCALDNNGQTPFQILSDPTMEQIRSSSSPECQAHFTELCRALEAAGDAYQILHQNAEQEAVGELRERRDALLGQSNEMQRMLDAIPEQPILRDALRAVQLRVQIEDMQDDIRHINAALVSRGIEG
jgi:hypothetical protein